MTLLPGKSTMRQLFKINKSLLPIKIHYFLFFTALGCGLPFRTVLAKQLGISGSGTGVMFAAMSLSRLVTNPLFGVWLDKFKMFRFTLIATVFMVSISHLAMVFIPAPSTTVPKEELNITCGHRLANTTNENVTCLMDCIVEPCNTPHIAQNFFSIQFWTFLLLMIVSSSSLSAGIFIMDTVCYEILGEKREDYGVQRLYGTMGWGIGALVGGYFNELFTGDAPTIDYSPCFYLLAGLALVDILPLCYVKIEDVKYSSDIWRDAKKLLGDFYVSTYIVMVFFVGLLSGFIWNYQFWFFQEIGASQLLLGLSQTVENFVAEVPCFLAAGWIIKKIGHMNCGSVTFLFFGLRYISFYYMYDPWWSLLAGLFHGPTFGLFYASMTSFAKEMAPEGTEATAQAILCAAFEAIGVAIGSFFGGVGIDVYGSRPTFLIAAILSFILLFLNIVMQQITRGKARKKNSCKNSTKL